MRCSTCGNDQLARDGQEYYCSFCHSRQPILETVAPASPSPPSIGHRLDTVMRLRVEDRIGTGFVISKKGLVLTNQHIVQGHDEIFGSFDGSSQKYSLRVIYAGSDEVDLCLLKIESDNAFPCLSFSKKNPHLGDEVSTIGNPRGIGLSLSKGIISRIGDDGDLQLNIQLNPGNSGGPVLNTDGELVGIISFLIEEIQAITFALGLPQINAFIEEAKGGP